MGKIRQWVCIRCARRSKNASDGRVISWEGPGTRPSTPVFCMGWPSRCISWQVRHGIDGSWPDSAGNSRQGPLRFTGATRSRDSALEVHAVAPQAVVHQHVGGVVFLVEEDARVAWRCAGRIATRRTPGGGRTGTAPSWPAHSGCRTAICSGRSPLQMRVYAGEHCSSERTHLSVRAPPWHFSHAMPRWLEECHWS